MYNLPLKRVGYIVFNTEKMTGEERLWMAALAMHVKDAFDHGDDVAKELALAFFDDDLTRSMFEDVFRDVRRD